MSIKIKKYIYTSQVRFGNRDVKGKATYDKEHKCYSCTHYYTIDREKLGRVELLARRSGRYHKVSVHNNCLYLVKQCVSRYNLK